MYIHEIVSATDITLAASPYEVDFIVEGSKEFFAPFLRLSHLSYGHRDVTVGASIHIKEFTSRAISIQ